MGKRVFRSDADDGGPAITFEDPAGEIEFEVLREGIDPEPEEDNSVPKTALDPDLAGKSTEEINEAFAKLRDSSNSASAQNQQINDTLEALNRTLGTTPAVETPAEAPVPPPALPDEDEFVRDPVGASQRLIDARVQKERQELGAAMAQQAQANLTLRMQLLSREDPYFAKYQPEIQAELDALAPNARLNPEALDFVVGRVKQKHQGEIVAEEVKKALAEERGQASGTARSSSPAAHVEGTSTGTRAPSTRKRVTLSIGEMNEARNLGLAVPEKDRETGEMKTDYSNYIRHVKLPREAEAKGQRISV